MSHFAPTSLYAFLLAILLVGGEASVARAQSIESANEYLTLGANDQNITNLTTLDVIHLQTLG